jgi:hypothetical protein
MRHTPLDKNGILYLIYPNYDTADRPLADNLLKELKIL